MVELYCGVSIYEQRHTKMRHYGAIRPRNWDDRVFYKSWHDCCSIKVRTTCVVPDQSYAPEWLASV